MRLRLSFIKRVCVRMRWPLCASTLVLCIGYMLELYALPFIWPCPVNAQQELYPASMMISDIQNKILRITSNRYGERCLPVPLNEISPHVIDALIAAEDKRFHQHSGCDFTALARACTLNLWNARRISGASTITMQWARIVEQRPRTYRSKLLEIFRARQWERIWNKDRIMNAYLNYVPWGGTLRGIEAAALYWYGKHARDLNAHESATLIAMLPAPSIRRPDRKNIIPYRNTILKRMHINPQQYTPPAYVRGWPFRAAHACDLALKKMDKDSTIIQSMDYRAGHYPRITLSIDVQQQESIRRMHQLFQQENYNDLNGLAVIVYDGNGVSSLIGSPSWSDSQWNAASAVHDAGSTLKPFLYNLAMKKGFIHHNTRINDNAQQFSNYSPHNFDRQYKGSMRLGESLSQSRNIPAIHILQRTGTENFSQFLKHTDLITSSQTLHLDSALGSNAVSPLQLAQVYYQQFCEPTYPNKHTQSSTANILRYLSLRCPDARQLSGKNIYWKTGTSSARRNAWSIMWNSQRVIVVWMGILDGSSNANCYGSGPCTEFASTLASALL